MAVSAWLATYLTGFTLIIACSGKIYYLDLDKCNYNQSTVYLMSGDSAVLTAERYGSTGKCSYSIEMASSSTFVSFGSSYISSCSNKLEILPYAASDVYYLCFDAIPYPRTIYAYEIKVKFTRTVSDSTYIHLTITNGGSISSTTINGGSILSTTDGYNYYYSFSSYLPTYVYVGIAVGVIVPVIVAAVVTAVVIRKRQALRTARGGIGATVVTYPSNPSGQASVSTAVGTTAAYPPQYAAYNAAFNVSQPPVAYGFTGQPHGTVSPPAYPPPPYPSKGPE